MTKTIIEKILSNHSDKSLVAGDIEDISIDTRVARDFGGANVVNHLRNNLLSIDDPIKTFFTFDCNPGGSSQKYATNQQICRQYARDEGIRVFDINRGIGSHVVIEEGLVKPGDTFVSTDSHANILGAIGAFGQGMGDHDIAATFTHGKIWFKVPESVKLILKGVPPENTEPKDLILKLLQVFGADGILGYAVELYGDVIDNLSLSGRITMASMATEMGGIIMLFPPNDDVIQFCQKISDLTFTPVYADPKARYDKTVEINVDNLVPLISRPGHPEDVVPVKKLKNKKIDSAFIGSCTNSRYEDLRIAADILRHRKIAPGVVLKIVPGTKQVWDKCLREGIIDTFVKAGALIGNPGCAGCASGQIGQNGPMEITISTGNRNYPGKQGRGEVYLASPSTVAASAVAGVIADASHIPDKPVLFQIGKNVQKTKSRNVLRKHSHGEEPIYLIGPIWLIPIDNIDTDMIFHNNYLTTTDLNEMGQYALKNLKGWENFSQKAMPGDIIVTGKNFGAGSSRQQAVDCFKSLGIQAIVAVSFGAIYQRNAINAGFPILTSHLIESDILNGEEITIDLKNGEIVRHKDGKTYTGSNFSDIQMDIYQQGGLLNKP